MHSHRLDFDFPVLHGNSRTNRHGLIYDLMEPFRSTVDRMLYHFMKRTTLTPQDFFETRECICKIMPEAASKIILLVRSLDSDILSKSISLTGHNNSLSSFRVS